MTETLRPLKPGQDPAYEYATDDERQHRQDASRPSRWARFARSLLGLARRQEVAPNCSQTAEILPLKAVAEQASGLLLFLHETIFSSSQEPEVTTVQDGVTRTVHNRFAPSSRPGVSGTHLSVGLSFRDGKTAPFQGDITATGAQTVQYVHFRTRRDMKPLIAYTEHQVHQEDNAKSAENTQLSASYAQQFAEQFRLADECK